MSLERIDELVHELIQEDDALTDPKNCRDSAIIIAHEVRKGFPDARVVFLAYPEARAGMGVHYSVLVAEDGERMILNPVAAPGFPQYVGSFELAVPTFSIMKESDTVL